MNAERTSADICPEPVQNRAHRAGTLAFRVAMAIGGIAFALAFALAFAVAFAACDGGSNQVGRSPKSGVSASTAAPEVAAGFVAFGDFGGGIGQAAVAQAMQQWARTHPVDALVTTGDNVYDLGEPAKYPAQLDAPYAALRASRPMWVTLGNHDAPHGREELAHLQLPGLPFVQSLPGIQLLFVDANRPDAAQAQWLDQQLGRDGPRLRVVVFHQPAYSCGVHGSTAAVGALWVPVLERHKVALVLNGHDHDYERFVSPAGVTYVVTGGGGQNLYPTLPLCALAGATRKATASRHHFTAVTVRGSTMTLQAVGTDGTVFDRATIKR